MSIQVKLLFRRPRSGYYSIEGLFENILRHFPDDINASKWVCPYASDGILRRLLNIGAVFSMRRGLSHITGDVHYLTLGLVRDNTILTIHDGANYSRLRGVSKFLYGLLWFRIPMRRARVITVISKATRDYLSVEFGVDPNRLKVIPDCVSNAFVFKPHDFHASCPRILQVGTKNNKNINRVARAIRGLNCHLRIVGILTDSQVRTLQEMDVDYSVVDSLTEDELVQEYVNCDMLIFASVIEGFGMPIVEAQKTGRPVVTSNCSSMPEVAGDGACLVDPYNVGSIRTGILQVIEDQGFRQALIEKGLKNAQRFSVETVAEQYAELYRGLG